MQAEGDETDPPLDSDRLSVAEVRVLVDAVSDVDMARLLAAARAFSRCAASSRGTSCRRPLRAGSKVAARAAAGPPWSRSFAA